MSQESVFRRLRGRVPGWDGPDLRRLLLPASLLVGFLLVFALCLIAQRLLTHGIADVEAHASASTLRYVRAEELLSTVRTQRLWASIYLRDARIGPGGSGVPRRREQLDEAERLSDEALSQYVSLGDLAVERENLEQLRQEMRGFWNTVPLLLTGSLDGRTWEAGNPPGTIEATARILNRISEVRRAAFMQQQTEVEQAYRVLDRRIWVTSIAALACGSVIAVVVIGYATKLERRIRRQLANQRRLAAKLIRAQEEERRSIARELHDEIGQVLTSVSMELDAAQTVLDQSGQFSGLLDAAKSCTDTALDTARNLSQLLHPSLLDHLGLPAALDWYLQRFSRRTRIRGDLETSGAARRFTPELETCIYRIAQEGLTNIARHAGASHCCVRLHYRSDRVLLAVEDNGAGFDLEQQRRQNRLSLGLLGVRERVSEFGGTFWLDTAPGRGTRLSVELPCLLRPAEEEDDRDLAGTEVPEEAYS